ncbi:MAG: Uncharacterized protein G01um101430_495 [Parcubacteria group bacterium Gr01-1014_30]|nr:MAG: Uncharacterized protein G01um101430_495 [Parcubacteria group bacterium Gr01-1014_30]
MPNNQPGFTLFEILLAVAILAILISITIPLGLDFYKSQQLEANTQGILQTLRRAQSKAMSAELDFPWGVYLTNDNYILFRGSSYASRDSQYDEVFDLPLTISLSGISEIVFSKLEGRPNVTGDIILSSSLDVMTININEAGRVNLQ